MENSVPDFDAVTMFSESFDFPTVLALDFDGVVCNGLKEYFKTAWRAYCNLWQADDRTPTNGLAESFYRLRPVVETGWEMPLVLRAILQGISEEEILQDWPAISSHLIAEENLQPAGLMTEVDGLRDEWIATDLESWLVEHQFYPGVCDRIKQILETETQIAIISTKEGRFIQQLLEQQDIDLTDVQIFGKEVKRPKADILQELMQIFGPNAPFWFVEDRLKTLQTVEKRGWETITLFLADWGYNTATERELAANDPYIHLLSLEQFANDFPIWLKPSA